MLINFGSSVTDDPLESPFPAVINVCSDPPVVLSRLTSAYLFAMSILSPKESRDER